MAAAANAGYRCAAPAGRVVWAGSQRLMDAPISHQQFFVWLSRCAALLTKRLITKALSTASGNGDRMLLSALWADARAESGC